MTPRYGDGSRRMVMMQSISPNQDRTSARLQGLALRRVRFLTCACLLVMATTTAPVVVADGSYVVVKAGRVITISGEDFKPGVIVIEDGKIALVGDPSIEYPKSARIIDASRETVMPGFVLPRTRFGLAPYERSGVQGDQDAASEVRVTEIDFTDLLEAGYTSVCYVPDGKGIPGMAAVRKTAGSDETVNRYESAYLEVATRWDGKNKGKALLRDALKKAKAEIEKVEKARKEWEAKKKAEEEKAKKDAEKKKDDDEPEDKEEEGKESVANHQLSPSGDDDDEPEDGDQDGDQDGGDEEEGDDDEEEFTPPEIDPKHQPLVDLIQKKEGAFMMVRLGRASDLHHLDDVLEPYDELPYTLFLALRWAVTDFHHITKSLGERKAKVTLFPLVNYLPYTTFRYNLWNELASAGCELSVIPVSDRRSEFLRMRTRLASLVRAGLPRDVALKSTTLHSANAIGMGDRLGSLEKGKDADLVFLNGDPLDPHADVQRVMILGEFVWTAERSK